MTSTITKNNGDIHTAMFNVHQEKGATLFTRINSEDSSNVTFISPAAMNIELAHYFFG